MEIWKDVPGYEGLYQVSNMGRVKSFYGKGKTERILNPFTNKDGYKKIELTNGKTTKTKSVHTLVLNAFLGFVPDKDCNHKNGNKADNRLENLEYCTKSENVQHAYRFLGKVSTLRGSNNWTSKLSEDDVKEIKDLYATGKYSQKELGYKYGVTQSAIFYILNGKNWKHLTRQ